MRSDVCGSSRQQVLLPITARPGFLYRYPFSETGLFTSLGKPQCTVSPYSTRASPQTLQKKQVSLQTVIFGRVDSDPSQPGHSAGLNVLAQNFLHKFQSICSGVLVVPCRPVPVADKFL